MDAFSLLNLWFHFCSLLYPFKHNNNIVLTKLLLKCLNVATLSKKSGRVTQSVRQADKLNVSFKTVTPTPYGPISSCSGAVEYITVSFSAEAPMSWTFACPLFHQFKGLFCPVGFKDAVGS